MAELEQQIPSSEGLLTKPDIKVLLPDFTKRYSDMITLDLFCSEQDPSKNITYVQKTLKEFFRQEIHFDGVMADAVRSYQVMPTVRLTMGDEYTFGIQLTISEALPLPPSQDYPEWYSRQVIRLSLKSLNLIPPQCNNWRCVINNELTLRLAAHFDPGYQEFTMSGQSKN